MPHQRANLASRSKRVGSPTSHSRVAAAMGPMPGSSRKVVPCWSSSSSMSRSRRRISRRAVRSWSMNACSQASRWRPAGVVAVSGSIVSRRKRPTLDLAGRGELVADLGGELGDLVGDVAGASKCEQPQGFCGVRAPPRSRPRQGRRPPEPAPVPGSARPTTPAQRRPRRRRGSFRAAGCGAARRHGGGVQLFVYGSVMPMRHFRRG